MSTIITRSLVFSIKNAGFYSYSAKIVARNASLISLDNLDTTLKKQEISKAMQSYMERATEYDKFMKQQQHEFKIGKRHLANIMGEDPETFTQEDVDRAIEYLFPSGIYDKRARPMMKSPEEIFPSKKTAEFDEAGRPHHFLFYTGRCNFYNIFYDIRSRMKELFRYEDLMTKRNLFPDPDKIMDLSDSEWITKLELERLTMENLTDKEYEVFIATFHRLIDTPYSYNVKDFIMQFRKVKAIMKRTVEIPQPLIGDDGRKYITVYECLRRNARGDVTIRSPGTGKFSVNGKDLTYFHDVQSREQILFPLLFSEMLNKVDIECNIEGGGYSGQSGALRWGISWALRSFVEPEIVEKMNIAGLLTRDPRKHERKKVCQPGARKKKTWKKR